MWIYYGLLINLRFFFSLGNEEPTMVYTSECLFMYVKIMWSLAMTTWLSISTLQYSEANLLSAYQFNTCTDTLYGLNYSTGCKCISDLPGYSVESNPISCKHSHGHTSCSETQSKQGAENNILQWYKWQSHRYQNNYSVPYFEHFTMFCFLLLLGWFCAWYRYVSN